MSAFAIASVVLDGAETPVFIADRELHRISDVLPAIRRTGELFDKWEENLDRLSEHLESGAEPLGTFDGLVVSGAIRVLPPVQPVGPILAAGANYREHIIQMSVAHGLGRDGATQDELRVEAAAEIDERVRVGDPYVWTGIPSAVSGAYDDLRLPDVGEEIDWELELGVVIGRSAHRVSVEDALSHVAGYVMVNDLTARSLVPRPDMAKIGTDWFRAKNQPGFFPTGPWLLPARFVDDPGRLRMRLSLNGETMQDATTDDLAFDVPDLISYTSSVAVLQPGDLLITGSPAGNGSHWGRFLRDGDLMEATIEGLGIQRSRVRAPHGVLPPWQAGRR